VSLNGSFFIKKTKGIRNKMGFFTSAIDTLQTVVCAIGAGMAVLGIINYMEAYSEGNPAAKSSGVKQVMAGGGIFIIGTTLVPMLATVF